jgi:serine/threonine-protein kinase
MQLVRGASAATLLRQRGPLPVAEAIRVVRQAAEGLAAAHALGLVHRDVKPANVLLGEDGSVKVADFGLARPACVATSTAGAGTPDFMSPEQAQGLPVDARADLYALAATFYCLLTGSSPFTGASAVEVMLKHVYDAPPDPRLVRPEVPEPVARLVLQALAKRPEDRPASVAEWAAELDRFLPAAPARSGRRTLALALAAALLPLTGALAAVLALSPPATVGRAAKPLGPGTEAVGPPHFEEGAIEAAPPEPKPEEVGQPEVSPAAPAKSLAATPRPVPTAEPETLPITTEAPAPRPKRTPTPATPARVVPTVTRVTQPPRPRPPVRVQPHQPARKHPVLHTPARPPHHGKH